MATDDGDAPIGRRLSRRGFLAASAIGAASLAAADTLPRAAASVTRGQTPLPSNTIPKFRTPLATFAGRRVRASDLTTRFVEFSQHVLPPSMYPASHSAGTRLWGYQVADAPPGWPGHTIEAFRYRPTTITYVNRLPTSARSSTLLPLLRIDQTIHWADPLDAMGSRTAYTGPLPAVAHLHGAEVPSDSDGAPEAWFTADGRHGPGYSTLYPAGCGTAVYRYPNTQPATTLWLHDHALGITRINVFAGMALFYLLRDEFDTGQPDNPLRLPAGAHEIELMIQDRLFDTDGQLRFPDGSNTAADLNGPPPNPATHPFWIPEFFGDAMTVNGRTWPVLAVEPRRYRFRFLNACNARFLSMNLTDAANAASATPPPAVPFWQIGTDGGLLDTPVMLNDPGRPRTTGKLFLAPSERADVVVDFSGLAGKSLILTNDGIFPFPSGGPPKPDCDGQIMRIDVTVPPSGRDDTFDPAKGAPLRGGPGQPPAMVRLSDPAAGAVAPGVEVDAKRQLVVFEQDTAACAVSDTNNGPMIDLLNNTKWTGLRDGTSTPVPGSAPDDYRQGLWITERPRLGATEIWEFLDTTPDSHPIHIHLIQFQILNRQPVDVANYVSSWTAAFPGGTYAGQNCDGTFGEITYPAGVVIPGYGPPGDYHTPNADRALGGNPAFTPFLNGPVQPPDPGEAGWKDTFKILPGMVNRVLIRWAPVDLPVDHVTAGHNHYAFDPSAGPGYVWHCHILDHEDNEMMRPYTVRH